MKKNKTYIAREKFDAIVKELGLPLKDNASFTQVNLGNGYAAYVPITKTVARVDLQFTPPSGSHVPEPGKFGRIEAQLDFNTRDGWGEPEILSAFRDALIFGASLPAYVAPKRSALPKVEPSQPDMEGVAEAGEEAKALLKKQRAALIKKVAEEKGVEVSPKADV